MKLPIRVRMTAWYAILLAVIVAGVGAFLVLRLRTDLTSAIDGSLVPATDQIAIGYHAEGRPEVPDVSSTVLSGERAASQVLDSGGRVIVAYGDPVGRSPMLSAADQRDVLAGRRITRTVQLGPKDERFRLVARAASRRGDPVVVAAGVSMAGVDGSVHRVLVLLLIAGPAALIATAAGGWWLAGRALRPIERLRAHAQEIGGDRLDERLAVPATGDEVARLAATLNTMLARIQRGVEEQHLIVADVSHELRSPLAAMRSELDVSLRADKLTSDARRVLESTREEVDRMSRTVDDLLTLSSADEGCLDLLVEPVDLRQVAAATVPSLLPRARSRAIDVSLGGEAAFGVGDHERLRQALGNLLDNAIKYSPQGGTVWLRTWSTVDEAVVSVEDEGPGIPVELRERVFDRFFRADTARGRGTDGSGIGLSIVREVARAHGGRVWVEAPRAGGSTFSLAIPVIVTQNPPEASATRPGATPTVRT